MEVQGNAIYDGQECVAILRNTWAADEIRKVFEKAVSYDRIMAKAKDLPVEGVSGRFDITHITKHDLRIGGDASGNGGYILHTKLYNADDERADRQRNVDIPYMAAAANLGLEIAAAAEAVEE